MDSLFYSLIQVSLGHREALSRVPSAEEWSGLFDMACKQAIAGVCFMGVTYLHITEGTEGTAEEWNRAHGSENLSETQYYEWAGMALQIQQRNEAVNDQCVRLQAMLRETGFRNSILKGQGMAALYPDELKWFRQSGDIDVYVQGGFRKAMGYALGTYGPVEYDYINAHLPVFKDTEVELHWRARNMNDLFKNRKLQKWVAWNESSLLGGVANLGEVGDISVPTVEFNRFYILSHIYGHMFGEGVGFRQVMDYYFVLLQGAPTEDEKCAFAVLLKTFGMFRFGKALMWVLQTVFGMEERFLLCPADEAEGRILLDEMMQGGNFGHFDRRTKRVSRNSRWQYVGSTLQHNFRLASHYPREFFWTPVWIVYHFLWKRTAGSLKRFK